MNTEGNISRDDTAYHRRLFEHAAVIEYPEKGDWKGRGIVICGGGIRYFTCAWVCIKMLRKLGCTLPIQVWHLGNTEMSREMECLLSSLNAEAVNARDLRRKYPVRILNGWELKPYSIIHSSFEEVLFLDADNVPVVNPEFLFDTPQYKEAGATFWPDFERLGPERQIWHVCGIDYRDEPEFETGQILINKSRCRKALNLAMHLNEHSDFYYSLILGDKETFHMAWRKLEQAYSMPDHPVQGLHCTMCQHDFEGRRIFQHRNMDKWNLSGNNERVKGFAYEEDCLGFLEELRSQWSQRIPVFELSSKSERECEAIDALTSSGFIYKRVGYDQRRISFLQEGIIGKGAAGCEKFWNLFDRDGILSLDILSDNGELTCELRLCDDRVWRGQWLHHEKMPIELKPENEVGLKERIEALPYSKAFARKHGVDLAIPNWPNSGIGNVLVYTRLIEDFARNRGRPVSIITAPLSPGVGVVDNELEYPLFENNPFIERIVNADEVDPDGFVGVNREEWSLANVSHIIENICFAYGIKPHALRPAIYLTREEKQWALNALKPMRRPLICIHPGGTTSSPVGCPWYRDNWLRMLSLLKGEADFFQIGRVNSVDQDLGLFNPGKTIREAMALIWAADLFVGYDSSPMHMATALQKPVITLIHMQNKFNKEASIRETFAPSAMTRWIYPYNTNFAIMPEDVDGDALLARVIDAIRQKLSNLIYRIQA